MAGESAPNAKDVVDDTVDVHDEVNVDTSHRNYDALMEETPEGTHFVASVKHVPGCRRRRQSSLGVSRLPFVEPIGNTRESFYEFKLVLGLAWYCPSLPEVVHAEDGTACTEYTFRWDAPEDLGGQQLDSEVLKIGRDDLSFEVLCNRLEKKFCDAELGVVCACCAETLQQSVCASCMYATGWHRCENDARAHFLWRKGTLHAGALDIQRCLFNLHRKMMPTEALQQKALQYVNKEMISAEMANRVIQAIVQERGHASILNDDEQHQPVDGEAEAQHAHLTTCLSAEEMKALLGKREAMMREGGSDGTMTDQ